MSQLVDIGKLRNSIELQELVVTTDEHGFHKEEWTTVLKTRAMVEFDKSYKLNKEIWSAEGIETMATRIFTFRSHPKVEVHIRQRIKYKDKYFQIYSVNDLEERGRFITVWANMLC